MAWCLCTHLGRRTDSPGHPLGGAPTPLAAAVWRPAHLGWWGALCLHCCCLLGAVQHPLHPAPEKAVGLTWKRPPLPAAVLLGTAAPPGRRGRCPPLCVRESPGRRTAGPRTPHGSLLLYPLLPSEPQQPLGQSCLPPAAAVLCRLVQAQSRPEAERGTRELQPILGQQYVRPPGQCGSRWVSAASHAHQDLYTVGHGTIQ